MTVIGVDDTDSRRKGLCTTYVATRLAERVRGAGGTLRRRLLVRLNPAVERKTRGNAALAVHTDLDAGRALDLARAVVREFSAAADRTSPGLVVADCHPAAVPDAVAEFCLAGLREVHDLADALALAEAQGWQHAAVRPDGTDHEGYGRIGALAAVGAWSAFEAWTYEHLAYRRLDRCGTDRAVEADSVFAAAEAGYPVVWDTVDRGEQEVVCVPSAPGPVLYGIRGDDPGVCRSVAARIDGEPADRAATFLTNQGTDAHLARGELGSLGNAGYTVDGVVTRAPETRRGGHTFFELTHPADVTGSGPTVAPTGTARTVDCAAFEPTKRFRTRVRALRVGDELTVAGEHDAGTLKLEKLAVRSLVEHEPVTPTCPDCSRTMESAGRNQGYRCRDCSTSTPGMKQRTLDRSLEPGWYEVPPCARRHVAKPLVRGGFDAPTHPER